MNLGVVNSNSVSSIIEFTTPEFAQAAEKYNGILLFGKLFTLVDAVMCCNVVTQVAP